MENYKKIIQQRLWAMGLFSMSCGSIYLVGGVSGLFEKYIPDGTFGDFFSGFQVGVLLAFILLCVFFLARYIIALNSEKVLKKMYIKETDERSVKISELTGVRLQKIVCFPLLFSAIIAGYFSAEVFFTLIVVIFFISLVTAVRRFYFNKIM
ncbi:MAG: hypothetical protein K2K91_01530 [Ruminococcus sp.]|nr:hypothetical protein [Ruminococcus sp.]MDE7097730.1 hypothetical protein [Ruminococcus sp.]